MQKTQAVITTLSILIGVIIFTSLISYNAIAETDYEIKKAQVQRCESLYNEYLNIGERKFLERYMHFRTDRNCVKLFTSPVWLSDHEDRIEKLVDLIREIEGDSRLLKERSVKNLHLIATWMKDDAKRWSEEKSSDSKFAYVIREMIKSKIIDAQMHDTFKIPQWLKKNTQWWLDGKISDSEYIIAIEYLMKKGIMQV